MNKLLTQKYKPTSLNDYVFRDNQLKEMLNNWVSCKKFPDLLICGKSGTGKSSLVNVLINEFNIDESDIYRSNGSDDTSVDNIRDEVIPFVTTSAYGNIKIVYVEEAERLSVNAQDALKEHIGASDNVRFIFTTNNPTKITDALKSRFTTVEINSLDPEQFLGKILQIVTAENIEISENDLISLYEKTHPDLRKAINLIDSYTIDGKISFDNSKELEDRLEEIADLLYKGHIHNLQKLVAESFDDAKIDVVYKKIIDSFSIWGVSEEKYDDYLLLVYDNMNNISNSIMKDFCLVCLFLNIKKLRNLQ